MTEAPLLTLREAPQAFARVQVQLADGRTAWGAAAELMAPKWFDKNLALSNEENFEQLRTVLRMARDAYLSDRQPAFPSGDWWIYSCPWCSLDVVDANTMAVAIMERHLDRHVAAGDHQRPALRVVA